MINNQKRLLILGGQLKMCDIVRCAQKMGIYTVVTDWYEDSPAKKIADKSYDVSTSDVPAILKLISDEHIDGVFTGYIDSTLPYYYEICKAAGLPCYLNEALLECCTNKRAFKDVCREIGMKCIPDVNIQKKSSLEYPILIKPADNSGSKGITVCPDESMIAPAYEKALRFSKSKTVITEKFMNCDYVCAHYIVRDGKVELSMLMDKDMNRIGRGNVPYPTAMVTPSRYNEAYLKYAHPAVLRLTEHLEIRNGSFLISFFVNGNNFYAVELTARLTATREYLFIKDICGYDTLKMHLNHALTNEFRDADITKPEDESSVCTMLFVFIKNGIIGRIDGIEGVKALRGVLNVLQLRDIGAKIKDDGSYGQLFARIHLKAEGAAETVKTVNEIYRVLQVFDEEERPMVISGFDAEKFFS